MPTHDPDEKQKVWRYLSFPRFVWMLQKRQLWFSRIDLLGDPWELTLSGQQLAHFIRFAPPTTIPIDRSPAPREPANKQAERVISEWRRQTYVSCWAATQHESHALWRIYCPFGEGVALQTTLARLRSSVGDIPVHRVTYDGPGALKQTPELIQLATEKRPMFAYEHEVRAIAHHESRSENNVIGFGLEWDPETALENIWVHPNADFSFMEAVVSIVGQLAPQLKGRVPWSRMQTRPPF